MYQLFDSLSIFGNWRLLSGIAIIIIGTVIAAFLVRLILFVIAKRLALKTKTHIDDKLLYAIRRPIYALVYLFGFGYLFEFFKTSKLPYLNDSLFEITDGIVFTLAVLMITHLTVRILSTLTTWFGKNVATRTETKVDDEFVPLVDRSIKVILYVLGILIVLDHFDINITGLITVLGVGSLAVALAAQETLANMIGGFVIMMDRPFRVGDRLVLNDGKICDVFQVGVRSTKFLTRENTLIIVPNAELVKSTIHNLSYPRPETKIWINVGVSYSSDLDKVKAVMLGEAEKHVNIMNEPAPLFRFLDFGDSSLDVSLYCQLADVTTQYQTESEVRQQILRRFRAEGIEIPFPQRVVTMAPRPQKNSKQQTPSTAPTEKSDYRKDKIDNEKNNNDRNSD
ncbi:MAG: mechanosensitive ion channel family protein [candidate division Zixibacteria bacterium]|nr:mechanosensitive ion channel family protein [candidate division Zixibacteria bacterium]